MESFILLGLAVFAIFHCSNNCSFGSKLQGIFSIHHQNYGFYNLVAIILRFN